MNIRSRFFAVSLVAALSATISWSAAPRVAHAEVSETLLALAGPLAENFGVAASAVTALLDDGVSLETVTQLLLVDQNTDSSLAEVTKVFHEQGDSVDETASELGVEADAYSKEKVTASLEQARADATAKATEDAKAKAAESTGKAPDSLGGVSK
jgi:hypothetical protein